MGVYIKGMQMPESCIKCMFGEEDEEWGSVCGFTGVPCLNIGRQDDCPLIPVPDHGRLIDADAMLDAWDDHHTIPRAAAHVIAKTVIPADRKEGEA